MAKGKFKKEKGRVVADIQSTHDMRLVVHENTDPELLNMFMSAMEKGKEKTINDVKE